MAAQVLSQRQTQRQREREKKEHKSARVCREQRLSHVHHQRRANESGADHGSRITDLTLDSRKGKQATRWGRFSMATAGLLDAPVLPATVLLLPLLQLSFLPRVSCSHAERSSSIASFPPNVTEPLSSRSFRKRRQEHARRVRQDLPSHGELDDGKTSCMRGGGKEGTRDEGNALSVR